MQKLFCIFDDGSSRAVPTTLQMTAEEAILLYRGMRLYMFFFAAIAMVYALNATVQPAVVKLGVDAAAGKSQLQLLKYVVCQHGGPVNTGCVHCAFA